jgi:aminomethyltransferase
MKNTPLYQEHIILRANMALFADWNMPIHYGSILDEARHTRSAVSIFDVSHMGEFIIREDPGSSSLDRAITIPVVAMKNKHCKYGFLLDRNGMILDDLIAYRMAENEWMLVVNAATQDRDLSVIQERLSNAASLENISSRTVKIDVQGPGSRDVMKRIFGDGVEKLDYYGFDFFDVSVGKCVVSRTGYTGELGFEIYAESIRGVELWRELLKDASVKPAGLGARDILRLEMGYPLYGSEITEKTTPVDGGMERFLDMKKEFTGREPLIAQMKNGVHNRLTGFIAKCRRTPRHGSKILADKKEAGYVTSGVFSPHLNKGIGMGYIDAEACQEGREVTIAAGREEITVVIESVPFLKNTSIRKREV